MRVVDLFCGCGGMGLSFQQAGFEIVYACDFDKYAVQSYRHNVGEHVEQRDIQTLIGAEIPKADVWTFGFPCQDISVAGNQAGMEVGTRSGLFYEVMRLLDESEDKPTFLLAENVKGLKKYLPKLKEEFEKRGYRISYQLYNSKFWGVPQNRERYYIVGTKMELPFHMIEEKQTDIPMLKTIIEKNVNEKYYLSNRMIDGFIKHNENHLQKGTGFLWKPRSVDGIATTIRANGAICPTDNTIVTSNELEYVILHNIYGGFKESEVRVFTDYSPTIRTAAGGGHIPSVMKLEPPYRVRRLTPRECARLQGFPDSYEIVVSDTQAYKQFGNSVTVPLVKAIAESIKAVLSNE